MKNLLALLLCVMLLVSVVPTAAFAMENDVQNNEEVQNNEDAIPAIDLRPAYEARNNLYAAYGLLGAAVAAKNTLEGLGNSVELFVPKLREFLPVVLAAFDDEIPIDYIDYIMAVLSNLKTLVTAPIGAGYANYLNNGFLQEYPNGVSEETLFKIFGSDAVQFYNILGSILGVGSTVLATDASIVGVYNDLNGIFSEFGIESVQPSFVMPIGYAE